MSYMKRTMALLLALAMSLCLVFSASAATSPTAAPTTAPTAAPTTAPTTAPTAAPTIVETVPATGGTDTAVVGETIIQVGNGSAGVFDAAIKKVIINSSAAEVTISTKAFTKSKVKTVEVNTASVRIKKNAFKGTKTKNPTIYINGAKKASDVKVGKGSFTGLSKKAKIVVSKKSMSKKQFNALKKKLRKKGFKGKIVRK